MRTEILWLDQNSQSTESFRKRLQDYEFVQTFNDIDTCLNYIETHRNTDLFLVASGTLAKMLVPRIVQYDWIKQIFVFCGVMLEHTDWASDYTDILLLFDHPDDLLERLWSGVGNHFRSLARHYTEQADLMNQLSKRYKQSCG